MSEFEGQRTLFMGSRANIPIYGTPASKGSAIAVSNDLFASNGHGGLGEDGAGATISHKFNKNIDLADIRDFTVKVRPTFAP